MMVCCVCLINRSSDLYSYKSMSRTGAGMGYGTVSPVPYTVSHNSFLRLGRFCAVLCPVFL